MSELMDSADGSMNLASKNRELFDGSEPWEQCVMTACVCLRAAKLIEESLKGNIDVTIAAECLSRVANIIDGVPKYGDCVPMFRSASNDLDAMDWAELAKTTSLSWANDVPVLLDLAKQIKH